MIYQIGDLLIDLREVVCIGNRENVNGFTCSVTIWLKSGIRVYAMIEGIEMRERNGANEPTPGYLMTRADAEIADFKRVWKTNNT